MKSFTEDERTQLNDERQQLYKQDIVLGEQLARLRQNSDFIAVIENNYFKEAFMHAASLLPLLLKERKESVHAELESIMRFKSYLDTIKRNSEHAQQALIDLANEEDESVLDSLEYNEAE